MLRKHLINVAFERDLSNNNGMADVLTAPQRSYNMSRIRSKGTDPEKILEALLKRGGLSNFVMHPSDVPGKPDFYFPWQRLAVFADGCFWHACKKCFKMPQTNKEFWGNKIETNVKRDRKVKGDLESMGIKFIRIWEHELKEEPEKALDRIRTQLIEASSPKVLDLFAGAGGLSEGFMSAGSELIGHIEMDPDACSTLVTRMIYHALVRRGKFYEYRNYLLGKITRDALIEKYDLQKERDSVICAKIGEHNYKSLIKEIRNRIGGERLDIIVGGPPCQAYSHIGRARDEKNMRWDHRKFLYRYYIEFLKSLKPKIFVFENVPGLTSSGGGRYLKEMRRLMKGAGYETDLKILNAVDFGVPQNRRRVILVGWHRDSKLKNYPNFLPVKREYVAGDFLRGLPKIHAGKGRAMIKFSDNNKVLKKLRVTNKRLGLLMDHVARPNNRRDLEIYKRAVKLKKLGQNIAYKSLPKRLKTHKNENIFSDRYKVVDASASGAHTVVAHIGKDGHYYIHPDINQNRSLTVREAARLQTFPDDYKFEGTRSSQFCQIGNAVPPILSRVIAKELIRFL